MPDPRHRGRVRRRLAAAAPLLLFLAAGAAVAQDADIIRIDSPEKARAQQEAWAKKLGKPAEVTNSAGMKLRLIPPGEFVMGCAKPGSGDEDAPPHAVRITRPFYLGQTEVTREQWEKVTGTTRSNYFPGPQMPINFITWYDTQAFFQKLGKSEAGTVYRLPTEAEWEFAARAGTTTAYATGDTEADLAKAGWYLENSGDTTHPVGQKEPNALGLYDMHGNVWEWCSDFYDIRGYQVGAPEDPTGPDLTLHRYRVLRGGSIYYPAKSARSCHRAYYQDSRSEKHIGFRVVLEIPLEAAPAAK
jgi:formylglycine-generating enzyme required for sulfatase activity